MDDEEVEDLLHALEGELPDRRFGDEVRLEVAQGCPPHLLRFLLNRFGLGEDDLYERVRRDLPGDVVEVGLEDGNIVGLS